MSDVIKANISDLTPDPRNANKGTQRGRGMLDQSLRQYGAGRSILLDKHNRIIAGNKTTEAAADIGLNDVVIVESDGTQLIAVKRTDLDLDDATARELAYADNRVAQVDLDWDATQMIQDAAAGVDLDKFFLKDELDEMLGRAVAGDADSEPQIDRAAELNEKWQVQRGDLWRIGEHRLLCGDSTNADDVALVMQNEHATLAPVDPPYNVGFDYDGETVDDDKSAEKYEAFSRAWFGICQSVSDRQIVTPGCNNLASWLRWFDAKHWAPWTKTNSMTNGVVSRFWCWEPVLFFGDKWKRSRSNDVFDFPIGEQGGVSNHPCPKPLRMWLDLIENYSEIGAIIFESFAGSGTTLVACQNLRRKCRAIEISPNYCAVILERMATAFPGIEIERLVQ